MTFEEFQVIGDALMDAFVEAGFTDASVNATLAPDGDENASVVGIDCVLPHEAVRLTELIRMGLRAEADLMRRMFR
jgi:hypothetical protein